MSVLRPRNRLVYFRLSEDDFLRLLNLCETHGLRSISDAARSAVQRMLEENPDQQHPYQQELSRLSDSVAQINRQLELLFAIVQNQRIDSGKAEEFECATAHGTTQGS
jgi:hypothetical protein